jgi:hypothetical protein
MSIASVLVVSDDALVRKLLTRRPEVDEYHVVPAAGGLERSRRSIADFRPCPLAVPVQIRQAAF